MDLERSLLTLQEHAAIQAYKDHIIANFGHATHINDLWVGDFELGDCIPSDRLNALDAYCKRLEPYSRALTQAANLRQQHFEEFIRDKKPECPKHKHWRENLNACAKYAEETLIIWQKQLCAAWDTSPYIDMRPFVDATVKNPDKQPHTSIKARYKRPRVSARQIEQRRIDAQTRKINDRKRDMCIIADATSMREEQLNRVFPRDMTRASFDEVHDAFLRWMIEGTSPPEPVMTAHIQSYLNAIMREQLKAKLCYTWVALVERYIKTSNGEIPDSNLFLFARSITMTWCEIEDHSRDTISLPPIAGGLWKVFASLPKTPLATAFTIIPLAHIKPKQIAHAIATMDPKTQLGIHKLYHFAWYDMSMTIMNTALGLTREGAMIYIQIANNSEFIGPDPRDMRPLISLTKHHSRLQQQYQLQWHALRKQLAKFLR